MVDDAKSPYDMDDSTATILGSEVFEVISSIGAAPSIAVEIPGAVLRYLDVLNKQALMSTMSLLRQV